MKAGDWEEPSDEGGEEGGRGGRQGGWQSQCLEVCRMCMIIVKYNVFASRRNVGDRSRGGSEAAAAA